MPRKYTPQERITAFWNKIDVTNNIDECWIWNAGRHRQGYGNSIYNGKSELAHRVVWTLIYGEIPKGLCVLHSCDNPPCCNPNHLFLGTQLDNIQDKVNKGRQAKLSGEQSSSHKLTDKQVADIRQRYAAGGVLYKTIAQEFGISIGHVGKLITRRHIKR